MTTQEDVRRWLKEAQERKAKFMIVVVDTFDYEDYPVFCLTEEECNEKYHNPGQMQRIMEVYDLSLDIEKQINEVRAFHPPK